MEEYEHLSPDDFPRLSGSYLIEKYLVGVDEFHRGCWVEGETVHGKFALPTGSNNVFTRPVFAYLDYLGTYPALGIEECELEFRRTRGHEVWFAHQAERFAAPKALELVNVVSELLSGICPSESWQPQSLVEHAVRVAGAERYVACQMKVVYAHWLKGGASECADLFSVQPASVRDAREGGFFLSTVATDLVLVRPASIEINAPLSRKMIYHLVFNLAFEATGSNGWNFNEQAADSNFLQY
ncbi:monalysin family beta-barrel pore-forming toxin [Pseudomonas alkylphenolica]|uniref:monalysin family beta-barrel pore-forming toxin n=1 Tax=Pseudomonas alkylphenolica TaxID=237609 RepID=UPI0018D5C7A2|nr:monalysin family beta-barrel pore-forming toxin [Pseudomonas alkylphenolica]MBH3430831.1 monalysin family beta-barrel pore-forming toxin [Pseudomonas alkylphenolica]